MSQEEINHVVRLAKEERDLMRERAYAVMKQGVKIRDPDRFDLRGELIYPGCSLLPHSTQIRSSTFI